MAERQSPATFPNGWDGNCWTEGSSLEIAHATRMEPELARQYDERVDSWLHRVSRRGLWRGAFEGSAAVAEEDFFMAEMARHMIEAAYGGA